MTRTTTATDEPGPQGAVLEGAPWPRGAPVPARLPRLLSGTPLIGHGAHLSHWGELPVAGRSLIEEIARAGLRGRGGAGFPAADKLLAASASSRFGRRAVVVANGTEGEPASFKDKTLLALAPHLVIDGAVAAARAIRATEVVVAVDLESRRALGVMDQAIAERQAAGVDAPIHVRVTATPSRYLTGQETALVQWLNGGDAKPTVVPPRPSDRGVGGRPTVVHNVETLAHIGLIARFGAAWYRGVGTAEDAGTLLVTVTGGVERPGVYEVPWGEPVGELVAAAGGVLAEASGLLVGGYYGTWLPVTAADTRLAVAPLAALGASAGAGVVAVLPPGVCPLVEAARVTRWLADQSAGQCGPCVNGLPALASALEAVAAGEPTGRAEAALMRWAAMVEGRGACHLPDGTARFVRSTLAVFGDHVIEHRRRGPCPAAPPVLATPPPGGWR